MGSENINDATKGLKAQGGSGGDGGVGGGEVGGEQVPLAPSPARVSQLPEVTRVMMTVAGTQSIPLILYHQAHDEGGVICDVDEFIGHNCPGGLEAAHRFQLIHWAFKALRCTAVNVSLEWVPMILHHDADDQKGLQDDIDRFIAQQRLNPGWARPGLLKLAIDTLRKAEEAKAAEEAARAAAAKEKPEEKEEARDGQGGQKVGVRGHQAPGGEQDAAVPLGGEEVMMEDCFETQS